MERIGARNFGVRGFPDRGQRNSIKSSRGFERRRDTSNSVLFPALRLHLQAISGLDNRVAPGGAKSMVPSAACIRPHACRLHGYRDRR
jgi:hypothetical protein